MNILTKHFAGQSLVSWFFQIVLIWIAWSVHDGTLPNNVTTITAAAIVLLLIYVSFAFDRKSAKKE